MNEPMNPTDDIRMQVLKILTTHRPSGEPEYEEMTDELCTLITAMLDGLESKRHKPFYFKDDHFMCCQSCGNVLNPNNIYKDCPGVTKIELRSETNQGGEDEKK